MQNISDIHLLFLILTGNVSLAVNRALGHSFKEHNIDMTTEQFITMSYLWLVDGVTQQDLCDKTNKDKPSITRLIDVLEKQNLVVRVVDQSDRRNNLIYLTAQGRELEKSANHAVFSVIERGLEGIDTTQLETCKSVLRRVLINIA